MENYLKNASYICKMKLLYLMVVLVLFSLLTACDAIQKADGIVLDKQSHKPLRDVVIGQSDPDGPKKDFYDSDILNSDSTGHYHYNQIGGSGRFHLYFRKSGYLTQKVNYEGTPKEDTIFLARSGN